MLLQFPSTLIEKEGDANKFSIADVEEKEEVDDDDDVVDEEVVEDSSEKSIDEPSVTFIAWYFSELVLLGENELDGVVYICL